MRNGGADGRRADDDVRTLVASRWLFGSVIDGVEEAARPEP